MYESYHDERAGGTESYIYVNTEENKPEGVDGWYTFVMRLNPDTGAYEVITLSKKTKTEKGIDSTSAPLKGILDGMDRIVGGAATGLKKGF